MDESLETITINLTEIAAKHPTQYEFIMSNSYITTFLGGIRSGKTYGGAEKAVYFIVRNIGCKGCVTAPTYRMLADSTMPIFEEVFRKYGLLKPEEGLGQVIKGSSVDGPKIILRKNLGTVLFRSTEEPDRLRGPAYSWWQMDEASQSEEYAHDILLGRLSEPRYEHQGWLTTTPKGVDNWVSVRMVNKKRENYAVHIASLRDNGFLDERTKEELIANYKDKGEWYLQEIEGQIVSITGQCRFDTSVLRGLLSEVIRPIFTDGLVEIFKEPVVGRRYIAGADSAEGLAGGDRSCLQIVDTRRGEQVCVVHGQIRPDEFAVLIDKYGRRYNNALVSIPSDPIDQATIGKLKDLEYPSLYKKDTGWKTTGQWNTLAETDLAEALIKGEIVIYRKNTILELLSYVRDKYGRCSAASGCHDDEVDALKATWQLTKEPMAYATTPLFKPIPYVQWEQPYR